jgi:tRNA (guanine-N7-)-methyltransferase
MTSLTSKSSADPAGSPGPAGTPRRIRSFVRRAGRMTPAQARALQTLWSRFGIDPAADPPDLDQVFGRSAPRVLEIGFGNGEALLDMAAQQPQRDFIGIEVHEPGVGHALLGAQTRGLANLRLMRHDAVEALTQQFAPGSLDEILIFFPDPWPKKRHHKRRLIQPAFMALLAGALKPGGVLRLATDWQPYAGHMLQVLNGCERLRNCADDTGFVPRPAARPLTRFERRGLRLGHAVWDLAYTRTE